MHSRVRNRIQIIVQEFTAVVWISVQGGNNKIFVHVFRPPQQFVNNCLLSCVVDRGDSTSLCLTLLIPLVENWHIIASHEKELF